MLEKILAVVMVWFPDVELDSYVIEALPDRMTIKLSNNYSLAFAIESFDLCVEELVEMYMEIKKAHEEREEAKRVAHEETLKQIDLSQKREHARIDFLLSEEGSRLCKPLEGESKEDTFNRIGDYLMWKGLLLPQESVKLKVDAEAKRNGTYVPNSDSK